MDNYRILGRIGEGAHGVVYKAKDVKVHLELAAIFIMACYYAVSNDDV